MLLWLSFRLGDGEGSIGDREGRRFFLFARAGFFGGAMEMRKGFVWFSKQRFGFLFVDQ